jgi:hypothetical protein
MSTTDYDEPTGDIGNQEEQHREFLLQACRVATLRAKLIDSEINRVAIALKGKLIDSETAVRWLREANLLEYFIGALPGDVDKQRQGGK